MNAEDLALSSQRFVAAGHGSGPRIEIGGPDGLAVAVAADGTREVLIGLPPQGTGPPPGWPTPPCDCCGPSEPSADDVAAATGVDVETVRRVLTHVFRDSR